MRYNRKPCATDAGFRQSFTLSPEQNPPLIVPDYRIPKCNDHAEQDETVADMNLLDSNRLDDRTSTPTQTCRLILSHKSYTLSRRVHSKATGLAALGGMTG